MQKISYFIEYNNEIIGVYDNYTAAKLFILSCLQRNFIKDHALIHKFYLNSCIKLESKIIKLDNNIIKNFTDSTTFSNTDISLSNTDSLYESSSHHKTSESEQTEITKPITIVDTKQSNLDNDKVFLDIANQKIELQHNINLLKKQKENMEEIKNVFENDLKIFKLFKQTKESNNDFEISELFIDKYKIMEELDIDNKLTLENFIKKFKNNDKNKDVYKNYFGSNSYEELFIKKKTNPNF